MRKDDMHSNVTLSQLKEGAVEELYQRALRMALDNIEDPNTEPTAKRTLTVKIELKPTPDRAIVMVDARVEAKLAAAASVQTSFLLKAENGKTIGFEPIQEQLFKDPTAN